ncbi:hypothetical protein V493_04776 [Pseudogymnoascus sp. VKM F-4281 (FW-2241)]|nr:hypothetical protein V493_04776 [Pseudogymnoascus sp. VKM F-4281 (FW-2241)]
MGQDELQDEQQEERMLEALAGIPTNVANGLKMLEALAGMPSNVANGLTTRNNEIVARSTLLSTKNSDLAAQNEKQSELETDLRRQLDDTRRELGQERDRVTSQQAEQEGLRSELHEISPRLIEHVTEQESAFIFSAVMRRDSGEKQEGW